MSLKDIERIEVDGLGGDDRIDASGVASDADLRLTILGGDFNAPQQAPEMLPLRERSPLRSVASTRLVTYRSMGRSYDHVFVGSGWLASDAAIVRSGPSDHWPVSATLRRVEHRDAGVEASS